MFIWKYPFLLQYVYYCEAGHAWVIGVKNCQILELQIILEKVFWKLLIAGITELNIYPVNNAVNLMFWFGK